MPQILRSQRVQLAACLISLAVTFALLAMNAWPELRRQARSQGLSAVFATDRDPA